MAAWDGRDRDALRSTASINSASELVPGIGKRTLVEVLQAQMTVQRRAREPGLGPTTEDVQAAAVHGTSGAAGALPHLDTIQRSFGRHDVSQIKAHTDNAAREGAAAMGAQAYAAGDHVAFADAADLHTAAHEAAHVVQQRGGVQLKGGLDDGAGDPFEQHADHVADAVVAGRSAEDLLDRVAGSGTHEPTVQRKPAPAALAWRNTVIEGESRIQEVIRAAQRERRGRVQLDLVIEPDFVGIDQHTATDAAPPGKDPDGAAVHQAAITALRDVADQAPSSRRVMTVVLDRTEDGWERSRFALTGEAKPADTKPVPVATWQLELTNALELAHAARHGQVRMDVACTPDGVRILSWRSSGASTATTAAAPSAERAAKAFGELAALAGGRTLVYELRHRLGDAGWEQEAMHLIGEVKPPEAEGGEAQEDAGQELDFDHDPDDAQEIVADIKNKRRLVLATAAELIAEQDPTRLDNMIFTLGPLVLVGMATKLKKIARLGRKWKARDIKDAVCERGCEGVARLINKHVGGKIVHIEPKGQPYLGRFRGHWWKWTHHEVVVKDGRVYDITTGHKGLTIAEYKQLWEDVDAIHFGF